MNTDDWNYAKQVCIEAKLYRLTQSQIDDLELKWIDEEGQPGHCILNENATKRLTKKLSKIPDLAIKDPRPLCIGATRHCIRRSGLAHRED